MFENVFENSANINHENILITDICACPSIWSQINEMPQLIRSIG